MDVQCGLIQSKKEEGRCMLAQPIFATNFETKPQVGKTV